MTMRDKALAVLWFTALAAGVLPGVAAADSTAEAGAGSPATTSPRTWPCQLEFIKGDYFVSLSFGGPTICRVSHTVGDSTDYCVNPGQRVLERHYAAPVDAFAMMDVEHC